MSLEARILAQRLGGDEQTNERKSPCVLQDIVPFGAAAQKPGGKKLETKARGKRQRPYAMSMEGKRRTPKSKPRR